MGRLQAFYLVNDKPKNRLLLQTCLILLDFKELQESLTFFNLMNYDFDGPWGDTTGLVAPLYRAKGDPDPTDNAHAAVQAYLSAGVKPEKIVFGMPFYGYEWTGVPSTADGLFQPGTPVGDGAS